MYGCGLRRSKLEDGGRHRILFPTDSVDLPFVPKEDRQYRGRFCKISEEDISGQSKGDGVKEASVKKLQVQRLCGSTECK